MIAAFLIGTFVGACLGVLAAGICVAWARSYPRVRFEDLMRDETDPHYRG